MTSTQEKAAALATCQEISVGLEPPQAKLHFSGEPLGIAQIGVGDWRGLLIVGHATKEKFWGFTCPCGVTVEYPLNGLPEVTTKHPCGNPNHFTVSYDD